MPSKKRAITVVKLPIIISGQHGQSAQSVKPVHKVFDIDATLEDLLRYVERVSKKTTSEIVIIFEDEIPDAGLDKLDVIPGPGGGRR